LSARNFSARGIRERGRKAPLPGDLPRGKLAGSETLKARHVNFARHARDDDFAANVGWIRHAEDNAFAGAGTTKNGLFDHFWSDLLARDVDNVAMPSLEENPTIPQFDAVARTKSAVAK